MNDFELAKDVASDENFSHRPTDYLGEHMRGSGRMIGVIGTSGERWRRCRRFALSTLKGVYSQWVFNGTKVDVDSDYLKIVYLLESRLASIHLIVV